MDTILEKLVSNVLQTDFAAFSDEFVEDAKKRIIDIIGCAIGGANASGNSILLDTVKGWGGKKEATILVHGDKVPLHNAAMVNAVMARSYDYEATGPEPQGESEGRMAGHICSTVDTTAMSVAEQKGLSGKDLITAVILGGDMAVRVAVAEDFSYNHSFELTGTANAFGATAVVGRLWGMNKHQMINAYGILLNSLAGSFQSIYDGVQSFKLTGGLSARNAIFAAELSIKGFTGVKDPLLSPRGYFPQYCKSYNPDLLTRDIGKVFYVKGQHKMHPSCTGNHNPIDCCLEILQQHDINVDDIDKVTIDVAKSRLGHFLIQPFEEGDSEQKALFNIPYSVANVLLRKSARIEHYTEKFVQDPRVIDLIKKVKIELTLAPERKQSVVLKIKMRDGREYSASRDIVRGWQGDPVTIDDIKNKFWINVDFSKTISTRKAKKALELLDNLEEIDNVAEIFKFLVI